MDPYIFIVILGILCCIFGGNDKKRQFFFGAVFWFSMFIISGLRSYTFNLDTVNYLNSFKQNSTEFHIEYLFYRSMNIIRHPRLWLLFIQALIYFPLIIISSRETKYCCLAAFIYLTSSTKFFTESFNIIRQCVAASFILFSFVEMKKNNKGYSYIYMIIAILFHFSSIIAVPFWFINKSIIYKIFLNKYFSISLIIGTFLLGLSGIANHLISDFIFSLDMLGGSSSGNLSDTLSKYSAYGGNGVGFNHNFIIATCLPITLLTVITYPNTRVKRDHYKYFYTILLIVTSIGNIIIPSTQFGFRLTFAISVVQILVFPLAFQYSSKKQKWLLLGYLTVSLCLFLYTLPTLMPSYSM